MYFGIALFGLAGGIAAQTQKPEFLVITFSGFALFAGSMLYQFHDIRCPISRECIGINLDTPNLFQSQPVDRSTSKRRLSPDTFFCLTRALMVALFTRLSSEVLCIILRIAKAWK